MVIEIEQCWVIYQWVVVFYVDVDYVFVGCFDFGGIGSGQCELEGFWLCGEYFVDFY